MAVPRRVVLDACVFYPPSLRDVRLTLAAFDAFDAFDVVRSPEILSEFERNVLADHPNINPERVRSRTVAPMHRAPPGAMGHASPEDDGMLTAIDPGDRHVASVALRTASDAIVTINVRHFPPETLQPWGASRCSKCRSATTTGCQSGPDPRSAKAAGSSRRRPRARTRRPPRRDDVGSPSLDCGAGRTDRRARRADSPSVRWPSSGGLTGCTFRTYWSYRKTPVPLS